MNARTAMIDAHSQKWSVRRQRRPTYWISCTNSNAYWVERQKQWRPTRNVIRNSVAYIKPHHHHHFYYIIWPYSFALCVNSRYVSAKNGAERLHTEAHRKWLDRVRVPSHTIRIGVAYHNICSCVLAGRANIWISLFENELHCSTIRSPAMMYSNNAMRMEYSVRIGTLWINIIGERFSRVIVRSL